MTKYFIISAFLFIAVYDVFLKIKKGGTITSVMRSWYQSFLFVPFAVGVVFLGHFFNFIHISSSGAWIIGGLAGFGVPVLVVSIILDRKKITVDKIVTVFVVLFGYLIGDLFW